MKGEGGGWKASFDWLIKESNMLKVLEGTYADNYKTKPGGGRKEPVPGWCKTELGDAELEAIQRMLKDSTDTVGNNPELADRAEKLRQELQGV